MGIRNVVKLNSVGCHSRVLDAKVCEYDPEKLDHLRGDQQGNQPYSRIFFLD
jgi:hypothetical protein